MIWKTYKSINSFDKSDWDRIIGEKNPFSTSRFMEIIEEIHPEDSFNYILAYKQDKLIGIAFFYITSFDILQVKSKMPIFKAIRSIFPNFMKLKIGMSACWETYGNHIWWDKNEINYHDFCEQLNTYIKKDLTKHTITIFRDYLDKDDNSMILETHKKLGFINAESIPVSEIKLKQNITPEEYFFEIKSKQRIYMRKIIKDRSDQGLQVEIIEDFTPLLDQIYPLYLNVHGNAKEFQTPPLPKKFFIEIKEKYKDNAKTLVIYDQDKVIVAFVLLANEGYTLNPFLIGMDYTKRNYNLWYHCVWESIMYGINSGMSCIDLGATNFSMKQKLGAIQIKNTISLRFRNNIINGLLKKTLVSFAK